MIILQTATSDTFVTDMSTSFNKGSLANFGQSSTVDLFKIAGEKKNVKSRALMTVLGSNDGDFFKLTDYSGIEKTFEFNTSNIQNSILVSDIDSIVNQINLDADLKIKSYKIEDNKLLLQQQSFGISGDTVPEVSQGNTSVSITEFVRFEHSAVLLSYDLKRLKSENIDNINNSVFTDNSGNRDFKAAIKLSDVTTGLTHPRNFKVRIRVLKNNFKEGLGKDILHFSDLDDANFVTINSEINVLWETEGFVSQNDVVSGFETTSGIVSGQEDLYFDISDYIFDYFKSASSDSMSESFVVDFHHDNLFDKYTYFVKKLGSRNLSNRHLRPRIEIKLRDDKFENISYNNKKRFLDNQETFYISNLVNKKSQTFPNGSLVKLNMYYYDNFIDNTSLQLLKIPLDNSYIQVTDEDNNTARYGFNSQGSEIIVDGIVVVTQNNVVNTTIKNSIELICEDLKSKIETNQAKIQVSTFLDKIQITQDSNNTQETFVSKKNDVNNFIIIKENFKSKNIFDFPVTGIQSQPVYDYKGNLLQGIVKFIIDETDVSRFNPSNAFQDDLNKSAKAIINLEYYLEKNNKSFIIEKNKVEFNLPDVREEDLFKKIYVALDSQQKHISADDSIKSLMFSFIDTRRQYNSVNTPIDIVSEDLGEISYKIYNVDSGRVLIDDDDDAYAKIVFNGKHYVMNLFASHIFKNIRVGFVFEYKDNLTGLSRKIHDKSLILRFE